MTFVRTLLKQALPYAERAVTAADQAFSGFVQPRRARGKLVVQPYVGWGSPEQVEVQGRVLLPRVTTPPRVGDARWRNFLNIMRRLFSREVSGVEVTGTFRGEAVHSSSGPDGYFNLVFHPGGAVPAGWYEAPLSIEGRGEMSRARVQVVDHPAFGIISDLDDTVIQSDVTSMPRMLMTSLTGNARTRLPFPGVGAFYHGLVQQGGGRNPIFYVSSSPWNFFDLLWQFLSYRQIPLGPMFLRNWGFDLLAGHNDYKHGVIERIFERFPDMKFVLVGDSGEHDPQIYAEVVRRHPGRVLAVYIRDVSDAATDQAVLRIREEVRAAGVEMVLAADSLYAAGHAMAMGLITPEQMRRVQRSVARHYSW
ncbi:App1 family protein [Deinococcus sp. Marseille-Q6407]|uniref:App1 family protein n=1 Tax=Deinococcus sp. Marseille-Q6407 TaxID=2969223 RepID=UPI0021C0EDAC|nr:phosphatase domain-containing protein [Deinococcus sp. Marseille-Q6407]